MRVRLILGTLAAATAACTLLVPITGLRDGPDPTDAADAGNETDTSVSPDTGAADIATKDSPTCVPDPPTVTDAADPAHLARCGATSGVELLSDFRNCGRCGHVCVAACTTGICNPVRDILSPERDVGVGHFVGRQVAWFSQTTIGHVDAPLDAGADVVASIEGGSGTRFVTMIGDEMDSFVFAVWSGADTRGSLFRLPGGREPFTEILHGAWLQWVILDGDWIVFTRSDASIVSRMKRDGTEVDILVQGTQPRPHEVVKKPGGYFVLAHDILAGDGPGKLFALDLEPRQLRLIAQDLPSPYGLTADDNHVYWGERTGKIRRLPVTAQFGDTPEPFVDFPGDPHVLLLDSDATYVYWQTDLNDGNSHRWRIYRQAKCGGAASLVGPPVFSEAPRGMIVRDGEVYVGGPYSLFRMR